MTKDNQDKKERAKDSAKDIADSVSRKAQSLKDQAKTKADTAKVKADLAKKEAGDKVEDTKESVKQTSSKEKASAGAVAGVALASAAALYFLSGSEGRRRRKKLKGWMLEMKGNVMNRLESAEEVTKEKYHETIDEVAEQYKDKKAVGEKELEEMTGDLKNQWADMSHVADEAKKTGKDVAVIAAKKLQETDSVKEAGKDVRDSLGATIKHALSEGIKRAAEVAKEDTAKEANK